ncbi:hypothetical protein MNBD_GAMMA26-2364 [hydrothermal vent metagenome]|uniref:Cytochrome c domain-containing protein n=1 Tax=hydrothermal vent metagenome TaxID=652676 RepID=A0A3B1C133_9ZZZZ
MFIYSRVILIFGICLIATNTAYSLSFEDGKKLYNSFCIHCHGIDGTGTGQAGDLSGVPTGDLSNQAYMSLLSDDEVISRVAYGEEKYPYLQMPGWRSNLSNEEIKVVVDYVRTLAVDRGPLAGPTPAERSERFKNDPLNRGKIYYLRFCSGCHGKKGDGKGWMASKALNKPIAIGSPEIASALTFDGVKSYVTDTGRWGKSYMPIFPEEEIIHKLDEILAYIRTLPEKYGK